MTPERERLAELQARLLETLADAPDAAAAIEALRALPEAEPVRAWIESFEPRGVETGMELIRRWGARRWAPPAGGSRALVLPRVGAPFERRERARPEPGPGQVRLRVAACGVCGTDLHVVEGRFEVPLPITLGHEPVGVVDALGEGVSGVSVGDRVGVPWMQAGCGTCSACARARPQHCRRQRNWISNGGGFADAMIVEAAGCVRIPEALPSELAAPLFCAGFTAMSGYRAARAAAGERVAVLGVGGLGHLAIQIAAAHGHEVVAVTRSSTKTRDARRLGASEVLTIERDVGRELAARGGVDIILSTTSDVRAAGASVRGLREGGRLVAMGLGEGPMPVDPMTLLSRQASVIGAMQDDRADLAELLSLAARGLVRPRVEVYRATQLNSALSRLAEGRVRYRAVLRWD